MSVLGNHRRYVHGVVHVRIFYQPAQLTQSSWSKKTTKWKGKPFTPFARICGQDISALPPLGHRVLDQERLKGAIGVPDDYDTVQPLALPVDSGTLGYTCSVIARQEC